MTGEELFMLGWSPILAAIWRHTGENKVDCWLDVGNRNAAQ